MIVQTEQLKDVCSKVLTAVDSNELSAVTETLELFAEQGYLYINVTNREYFLEVKVPVAEDIEFHATVNAVLFLKLISQITTETVELNVVDNALSIKANGNYNLPLIFDGDKLLELPRIDIFNITNEFDIDSDILKSILFYNSKEISKGTVSRPVQKLYYIDQKGAITFTTGACVNSFNLEQDVRILLNNRLVKLFKLFKEGTVRFTLGYDQVSDDVIQTKVKFINDDVCLTAVLSCDDTLLNSVPVEGIRGRANNDYPYSINVNKDHLIQTINRLLLFTPSNSNREISKPYSEFEFNKDYVVIYDTNKNNKETIYYTNSVESLVQPYKATLDLADLKSTLECCIEQYLTIHFGDEQAIVISRGMVKNIIPECCVS